MIQIITGIFLAMHYTPHVDLAFNSVEHIMRDVNFGWLLRYIHANGASMFFYCGVYTYFPWFILFFISLPQRSSVVCWCYNFILMILTAFLGYVLPWGQMSFWGATVIRTL